MGAIWGTSRDGIEGRDLSLPICTGARNFTDFQLKQSECEMKVFLCGDFGNLGLVAQSNDDFMYWSGRSIKPIQLMLIHSRSTILYNVDFMHYLPYVSNKVNQQCRVVLHPCI